MPLRKHLFITAYNRPSYFRETMDSWRHVRGFYDIQVTIRLEPSEFLDAHWETIQELDHPRMHVIHNPTTLGVLHHPWVGFQEAFNGWNDFVIRAEDDLVVSDDILEFFDWAANEYNHDEEIAAVCAYSGIFDYSADIALRTANFSPWVWGTWQDRWLGYIGPTWDHDYSTYNGHPGNQAGWDWNLNTRILPSLQKKIIQPSYSRVNNIGVWGVHGTYENFESAPTFAFHHTARTYTER